MKDQSIYLLGRYTAKPKDPRMTAVPGYMRDRNNIRYDEEIAIVRGISSKDRVNHNVVLNLTEEKVLKNSFGENYDFAQLFEYFYKGFGEQIDRGINQLNASR